MALDRQAILKRIAGSDALTGGNRLRDGRYRLVVQKLELADGYNGARFVGEFAVYSSKKVPVVSLKSGQVLDVTPNEVGSSFSQVWLLEKHPSAFGASKGFVLALFGAGDQQMTPDQFLQELDELTASNAARGMIIDAETYRHVTEKNAVEMVLPKFTHVQQTGDDIRRMREWLNGLNSHGAAAEAAGDEDSAA